jgi:hypothetical protein
MLALLVALVVGCAALVYQPWRNLGFDLEDFSEFRPILVSEQTVTGRLTALTDYYHGQGRSNALACLGIVMKWSMLGESPPAWQWLRFLQMAVIAVLLYVCLRAFGASRVAASLPTTLFLFSSAAAASYFRLTLGEVIAVLMMLVAVLAAQRFQQSAAWPALAAGIAAISLLIVSAKELLAICVLPGLVVALAWDGHRWRWPQWTRRDRIITSLVVAASSIGAVLAVVAYLSRSPTAYVGAYDVGAFRLAKVAFAALFMGLPVQRSDPGGVNPVLYPANVLVLAVCAAGIVSRMRRMSWLKASAPVAWCLAAIGAGALVYAPWPRLEPFYALPFLLGTIGLLSVSLDSLSRLGRAVAVAAVGVATGYAVVAAHQATAARIARRSVYTAAVEAMRMAPAGGSIVVETRAGSPEWQALAATMRRVAFGSKPLDRNRVVAATCAHREGSGTMPVVLTIAASECFEYNTRPDSTIVARYVSIDWLRMTLRRDSAEIGVRFGS